MKNNVGRHARKYAAGLGILCLCALRASAEEPVQNDPPVKAESSAVDKSPEAAIQSWPERPRALARAIIDKYGEPSRFDDNDLVWYKNGSWRKTVVYRKAPRSFLGSSGKDILEQTIAYNVPDDKVAKVVRFDDRLRFDKANGELSSRAETEDLNFLALNLADEIVTGRRSAEDARDFYRKTVKLSESGKTSEYMDGFVFTPSPDDSSIKNSIVEPGANPNPAEEPYKSGMPERVQAPDAHPNGEQTTGDTTILPNP